MMPTIRPNGTPPQDLVDQLTETVGAARQLLRALQLSAPNARDYQPWNGHQQWRVATQEHAKRVHAADQLMRELDAMRESVIEQTEDQRRQRR